MNLVRLLPVILCLLVLAAHFSRNGIPALAVACAILPFLLLVRRAWVARLAQLVLVVGGVEWVRALVFHVMRRQEAGAPWTRLAIILGVVAVATAASALVFRSSALRERYRIN